jgi:hypothetical protein
VSVSDGHVIAAFMRKARAHRERRPRACASVERSLAVSSRGSAPSAGRLRVAARAGPRIPCLRADARAARRLPAVAARAQASQRRPPIAVRGSRSGRKQSRLRSEVVASLRLLFTDAPRATSSCRRLIRRKAVYTNRRYSILMQFLTLLTSLRISPN